MKINPIGIQSYQQLERRDLPTESTTDSRGLPEGEPSVTISPQDTETSPRLAVQAPLGDYAEFLTPEERGALELLFHRFRDPARLGPAYRKEAGTSGENATVGHIIDVKV